MPGPYEVLDPASLANEVGSLAGSLRPLPQRANIETFSHSQHVAMFVLISIKP